MKVGGTTTQAKGVHIPLANNNNLAIIFYFINSDDALWPSLRAFTTTTLVLLLLLLLLVREAFEVPPPPFVCPSLLHPSTCFSAETKLYFSFLGHTHCRHTRTREQGSSTTDYCISLCICKYINKTIIIEQLYYLLHFRGYTIKECTFGAVARISLLYSRNELLRPTADSQLLAPVTVYSCYTADGCCCSLWLTLLWELGFRFAMTILSGEYNRIDAMECFLFAAKDALKTIPTQTKTWTP